MTLGMQHLLQKVVLKQVDFNFVLTFLKKMGLNSFNEAFLYKSVRE